MYLTKRIYIGNKYRKIAGEETFKITEPKKQSKNTLPIFNKINEDKISEIIEETGYWRKANQIHKWFVDNVQEGNDDCKEYFVPEEKLKKLLTLCKLVKDNPKMAYKFLPTESGFFFGNTDYDEYYYEQINETISILEEALKDPADFYYKSSW